jgi:hypothetical protein
VRGRKKCAFPFKRFLAFNNLSCTTVQACNGTLLVNQGHALSNRRLKNSQTSPSGRNRFDVYFAMAEKACHMPTLSDRRKVTMEQVLLTPLTKLSRESSLNLFWHDRACSLLTACQTMIFYVFYPFIYLHETSVLATVRYYL